MKGIFSITAMFALTLMLLCSANAGEWIETDTCEALTTTISVDGNASEWEYFPLLTGVEFLTAEGKWVVFEEYNGGVWDGPDDHTTSVAFAWDADYLYIYIHVVDDEHQNSTPAWNGDGAQIVFADENRKAHTHLYNYGLDNTQKNVLIDNEQAAGGGLTEDDVVVARDDSKKVTIYEARFSPKIIGLNGFKVGMDIGIGICVNDGDEGGGQDGQKGWSGWGPHSAVFGKNGDKTGLVTLSPNKPKAVDAIGKLATTWGAIKK